MDSQQVAQQQHQAQHYDQVPHSVVEDEEEHQHGKMSVLKKVKAKAKKVKDTLKLHGHGYNQDHHHDEGHVPDDHDLDEDEDEDDEMVEDPQIHGPRGYEAAAIKTSVEGEGTDPGTFIGRSGEMQHSLGKSSVKDSDKTESSVSVNDPMKRSVPEQLKEDIGRTSHIKEVPYAPMHTSPSPVKLEPTKIANPMKDFIHEQEVNRGVQEVFLDRPIELEEDAHAPKDRPEDFSPPNYQTIPSDPTGGGGIEAGISPMLRSVDNMSIYEPKSGEKDNLPTPTQGMSSIFPTGSHTQFSPELSPPIPLTTQEPKTQEHLCDDTMEKTSNQSSYTEKISYATSAIADKAILAKNVVASKLVYGEKDNYKEHETREGQDIAKPAPYPVEYGKKIASTVTEKLTPVYEKVAGAGSNIISKVRGTNLGSVSDNQAASGAEGQDKGVSLKEYFAEKLKPGDEDRALSEVVLEVLQQRKDEAEKAGQPMGKVTESEEVKRHLGSSDDNNPGPEIDYSSVRVPGKGVVDKLKGAVGSWFVKDEETRSSSQQSLGSSTGASSACGEENGERRLQESGN